MSDTFTASNGLLLCPNGDGSVRWEAGFSPVIVTQALREFFQHERDKELGRWRDPERPNRTVAFKEDHIDGSDEHGRFAVAYDEQTMMSFGYWEHSSYIPFGARETEVDWAGTLERFFAAHPEPKPWHYARAGQLWLIRFNDFPDADVPTLVKGGRFIYNDHCHEGTATLKDPSIVGGKQIWPEVPSE